MKKILFIASTLLYFSCDDGDLQIETLDFDSAIIQVCDDKPVTIDIANVMFKLNDTEALILELPAGTIKNEATTDSIVSIVSASGPSKITYRTFSDNVSNDYFCSDIPLTEPNVLDEIIAQGGAVLITTVISEDSTNYQHTIELSGISLVTSADERITDLSINDFGTVTTAVTTDEDGG